MPPEEQWYHGPPMQVIASDYLVQLADFAQFLQDQMNDIAEDPLSADKQHKMISHIHSAQHELIQAENLLFEHFMGGDDRIVSTTIDEDEDDEDYDDEEEEEV